VLCVCGWVGVVCLCTCVCLFNLHPVFMYASVQANAIKTVSGYTAKCVQMCALVTKIIIMFALLPLRVCKDTSLYSSILRMLFYVCSLLL